jgi:hypothetical protein
MSLAPFPPPDPRHHLAQVNVGRLLAPLDSPQLADFVAWLEPINALADASPGFVWRLQTEAGDATSIRPLDDERVMINLSVWESMQALWDYVYASRHLDAVRRRREWFERMAVPYVALWWLPAGTIPSVEEALERLDRLECDGPAPDAFTFKEAWAASGAAVTAARA